MGGIIKKAAKGAANLGSTAVKSAVAALLAEITREILAETGATEIAKEKIIEIGQKVIGDMGVDPKNIQRELLKTAIMKELNLK